MPDEGNRPFGEYLLEPQTAGTEGVTAGEGAPVPPGEEGSPFGAYAPETQTAGLQPQPAGGAPLSTPALEVGKLGLGKPRRIIIRGTIAKD